MAALPKNKKLTIFLVLATLAIWGTIAYKIISVVTKKTTVNTEKKREMALTNKPDDNFVLSIYERDPFLSIITDTATIIEVIPDEKAFLPKKPTVIYPQPEYCGLVKNESATMAIIKINNRYHFLEKGQKDSLVKVLNIRDTVIVVQYHNEKLTLPLRARNNQQDMQ